MQAFATLISWSEIGDEATVQLETSNGGNLKLTRGDDETLIKELRQMADDEGEDPTFDVVQIAHTPRTTHIEWKSCRGHCATSTIFWM